MLNNNYFETIVFEDGKIFKVSRSVDMSFVNRMHWHPFVEILVGLDSLNKVSVNLKEYVLKVNDILIIYPGDMHSILSCTESSMFVIQFSVNLLSVIPELGKSISLLSMQPYIPYDPGSAESERLVMMLKDFYEAYESGSAFQEARMYALMLNFFANFGKKYLSMQRDESSEAGAEKNTVRMIAKACVYISQNCTSPITLSDAAAFVGMSRSHFARLFKQNTTSTFVDFLTVERVRRAQDLFSHSDKKIIDIAFDSGFTSISSFNRAFKKVTGITPSEFRLRRTSSGNAESDPFPCD